MRYDQTAVPTGAKGRKRYPQSVRRINHYDESTEKAFNFPTNLFAVSATIVAELYRYRSRVELFLEWIKQHLRIKSFSGASENAVKSQIMYCGDGALIGVGAQEAAGPFDRSPHNFAGFEVLSLIPFEKTSILELFSDIDYSLSNSQSPNQLIIYQ